MNRFTAFLLLILVTCSLNVLAQEDKNRPPKTTDIPYLPTAKPDRILLSWEKTPSTSITVTWRTDTSVQNPRMNFAVADYYPRFDKRDKSYSATSELVKTQYSTALYHKVTIENLEPNTWYVYAVGDDNHSSEWIQFKTAPAPSETIKFIYMGDAQNKVFSHWSRVMRAAYQKAADADFILHVGDLINHADNEYEWSEWFRAGSFIHASIPTLALPGNHEYNKNSEGVKVSFSKFWGPQFNYPANGASGLQDQSYILDFGDLRIITLNSNQDLVKQADWLDITLQRSTQKWIVLSWHHPVYSASKGRVNKGLIDHWLPIIEKHNNKVDLVLQGHDHSYARGQIEGIDAVFTVSVGGPKMYNLSDQDWMQRRGENMQLYQVIEIENDQLIYKSYTPDHKVYDAFQISISPNGNKLQELPVEYDSEIRMKEGEND